MLAVTFFASTINPFRHFGDEGAAWLGVRVGLPLSLVIASVAFVLTIRRRLKRSEV
jgi:hypothetical protein